jgi:hypothetical protein
MFGLGKKKAAVESAAPVKELIEISTTPDVDCMTSAGNFFTQDIPSAAGYVTNGECFKDTYDNVADCPGNTVDAAAACPGATQTALGACPGATQTAMSDCSTGTVKAFTDCGTETGKSFSDFCENTGNAIAGCGTSTVNCVVDCPTNTTACVVDCPQNTTDCLSNTGNAIVGGVSTCATGTASAVLDGCSATVSTIAAIPGAILDCPERTVDCVSDAYGGLVDALTIDCGDPCSGIKIPTTIDECADLGDVACDALSCGKGNEFGWRSFIVLNQYSQNVINAFQPQSETKKDLNPDWKNAAGFNFFICHAFIKKKMDLEMMKKEKPALYLKYSNNTRISFKDPEMIAENSKFDYDYIVCEVGKQDILEDKDTEFDDHLKEHGDTFLSNHVKLLNKNKDNKKNLSAELQELVNKITKTHNDFMSKPKNKPNPDWGSPLVRDDFKRELDRMVGLIKQSSFFQIDHAYAKVIYKCGGFEYRLYALIKSYKYYPDDKVEMNLRFDDKESKDEFPFTIAAENNNNGYRLLKIIPSFHDVLSDDAECQRMMKNMKELSTTKNKDKCGDLTLSEQAGFLYKDKLVYVAMTEINNYKLLQEEVENTQEELIREYTGVGLQTKKRTTLDEQSKKIKELEERNRYRFGLDHSFRYYECHAVRVNLGKDEVEVGLTPGMLADNDDDSKCPIEKNPIKLIRILPYDPSNFNIINIPIDKGNEYPTAAVISYEIRCDGQEPLKIADGNTSDIDPYVIVFTPYLEDEYDWSWPAFCNPLKIPKVYLNGKSPKIVVVQNKLLGLGSSDLAEIPIVFKEMGKEKNKKDDDNVLVIKSRHSVVSGDGSDENIDNTYCISLTGKGKMADEDNHRICLVGDKEYALDKKFSTSDYVPRVLTQNLSVAVTIKKDGAVGVSKNFTFLARISLFEFNEKTQSLRMQLIYGNHLLVLPGDARRKHAGQKKDFWANVSTTTEKSYSIKFIHPETELTDIYCQDQRVTYTYRGEKYPGTVKDILFNPTSTNISIDLDRGDQGRNAQLDELITRPDLIKKNFDETQVFDYGPIPGKAKLYYRKKVLAITNKEFSALQEQRDESWIQLPDSIYGSATCFIIVNHEKEAEIEARITQYKEDLKTNPNNPQIQKKITLLKDEKNDNNINFSSTFFMLLAQIVFTFLMQGVLIWYVWEETPDPSAKKTTYTNTPGTYIEDDESGFCTVNPYLQIAAIAVLSIWTVSTFTDIWVEIRCYISKALVLENAETGEFRSIRVSKDTRTMFHHLSFFIISGLETIICLVVFIAGMKYVLNLKEAAEIVGGVLAITFVTDIDNKVYEIAAVAEGEDADVAAASFRVTDTDFLDSVLVPIQNAISCGATGDGVNVGKDALQQEILRKQEHHRELIKYFVQHYLKVLLSVVLVVFVFAFVFSNRVIYCDNDP